MSIEHPSHHESLGTDKIETRNEKTGDQIAIELSERLIKEGRSIDVGRGQSANVIKLEVFNNVAESWVIKKLTERTGKQQELGLTLEDEFRLHAAAYAVVEQAKIANPRKRFAEIPRAFSLLRDNDTQWLLMEYVDGETLFERAAKLLVLTYTEDEEDRQAVQHMKKEKLLDKLFKAYSVDFDDAHFLRIAGDAYRYTKEQCAILTTDQLKAIENTIEVLHKNGIHHRDLHSSNVMIRANGDAVIIDFGASIQKDPRDPDAGSIYTYKKQQIDERTQRNYSLRTDDVMLKDFAKVARKVK